MKDSPIILLDEALSSLDAENAVAIQKGIEEMIKGKTVFLVSHTLSYIQNSDQILVLSDGILQGCGKHEELLQTVPLYQTMWEKRNLLKLEAGIMSSKNKLHASGEDYLETILVLQKKRGMVRSVDVARHMEVSKPSVCHAVAILRDGGFLTMDEDHFLHLTDVGREVAEKSTSVTASLPSSLSPQALTPGLRRLTPAGLNTSSAMRAFHG